MYSIIGDPFKRSSFSMLRAEANPRQESDPLQQQVPDMQRNERERDADADQHSYQLGAEVVIDGDDSGGNHRGHGSFEDRYPDHGPGRTDNAAVQQENERRAKHELVGQPGCQRLYLLPHPAEQELESDRNERQRRQGAAELLQDLDAPLRKRKRPQQQRQDQRLEGWKEQDLAGHLARRDISRRMERRHKNAERRENHEGTELVGDYADSQKLLAEIRLDHREADKGGVPQPGDQYQCARRPSVEFEQFSGGSEDQPGTAEQQPGHAGRKEQ